MSVDVTLPILTTALITASQSERSVYVRRITFTSTTTESGVIEFTDSVTGLIVGNILVNKDGAVRGPVSSHVLSFGLSGIPLSEGASLLVAVTPNKIGGRLHVDSYERGPLQGPPVRWQPPSVTPQPAASAIVKALPVLRLQTLLPGELNAPNTPSGKSGTPDAQVAGVAFTVTVNIVDENWAISTGGTDTISITCSDTNATLPSNNVLSNGTQTFSITMKTAGSQSVTATDVTHSTVTAYTSTPASVSPAAFTKLQLLVPGELASPGSASGKTGTPNGVTGGDTVVLLINAVDTNWNVVTSVTDTVGITSSDGSATLPANRALVAGTYTYSTGFSFGTGGGSFTVTATDITDGAKTANTSPSVTVTGLVAWSQIATLNEGSTDTNGYTTTGSINSTNADVIAIAAVCYTFGGKSITNITDNKGNTYVEKTQYTNGSSADRISWWVCEAPTGTGTGHTFTLTCTVGALPTMLVQAWSGSKGAGSTDQVVGANNGFNTPLTVPTLTPSVNNELVLAAFGARRNGTIDSGYATAANVTYNGAAHIAESVSYKQPVSASTGPSWTFVNSPSNTICTSISFKPVGS